MRDVTFPAGDFGIQRAHDVDRSRRMATEENSGRFAQSFVSFQTDGVGSVVLARPLRFDTVFTEKPHLSSGVELLVGPNRSIYELPHVTVGVMRWQTKVVPDTRELAAKRKRYYVGAYVWARVWCDPVLDESTGKVKDQAAVDANPPMPKLLHHLTFAGQAYKDLPEDVAADLAAEL